MSSITIRNLDEELKTSLRIRAARKGLSMEQEVRNILRQALKPVTDSHSNRSFSERVHDRFIGLSADEIIIPERQQARAEPHFDAV